MERIKYVEGYWNNTRNDYPEYPLPNHSDEAFDGKSLLITRLVFLEHSLDPEAYRGWSTCRLCGCMNGSREYVQGDWRWPEGLMHYIMVHNVEPSVGFKRDILCM